MSKRQREFRLSRARARAEKAAATPDSTEALAEKAHDLDAARKTLEDAATVSGTLWFSYLFTLFYIAIAAGAVTQKDLLLENPVKLPFLNVELPLIAFFALAPILFVIAHAYTLMHFALLAGKIGAYHALLKEKLPDEASAETRDGLRRQLPSNIFVQFLAGPREIRDGGLGRLLQAVAWISLVVGPILLLLLLQIQFLPYHLEWATTVQRLALLGDLMLLWLLWPAVLAGRSKIVSPPLRRHWGWASGSFAALAFAFLVATFPGEGLDAWAQKPKWIATNFFAVGNKKEGKRIRPEWASLRDVVFNGAVDSVTRRRSLLSNTLVLPAFDSLEAKGVDDQKKLDWAKHVLSLRGRDLRGAIFDHADLRKADFDGAKLQGASLEFAQLQGASLNVASIQGASLDLAELQPLSQEHFEALKKEITGTPDGVLKDAALKRFESADPKVANGNDGKIADWWRDQAKRPPSRENFDQVATKAWREAGCNPDGAPYVIRALTRRLTPFHFAQFAKAFLDPKTCPAAAKLSDEDKAALQRIADEFAQAAPSPAPAQPVAKPKK
ncbi:pentapeptide repeat-containing protein [Methylocapsa acidiphila]|uniref:pentapeptide repeat-containing protein n=1 Tax=Methylocapsa acidiphila TaxID=133552 RepID=UPI0004238A40|nr:pentapeptide repeat-containing protein [Methylocapsa acidiphila]